MYQISIITINYNNASGLEKTLNSVLSQAFTDFEYIVIDGASTDGSAEKIQSKADEFSFWCSETDKGIYDAMNKGIKAATGNYILFLNSGDYFAHPEVLSKAVAEIGEEDLVYGNLMIVEEHRSWLKTYPAKLQFSYFIKDTLPHPATFIKRNLFHTIGLYNESLKIVADWEFFILAVTKFNCTYKHIPVTISEFMYDGISSKPEFNTLRLSEIKNVLIKNFPTFMPDYEEMERLRRENFLLKKSRLYKINQKLKMLMRR